MGRFLFFLHRTPWIRDVAGLWWR